jgi:hypothetical protein
MVSWYSLLLFAIPAGLCCNYALASELQVHPSTVVLNRPEASQQLLVTAILPDGRSRDVTRESVIEIVPRDKVIVDPTGLLRPISEGRVEAVVRHGNNSVRVPIEVRNLQSPSPVSFRYDVIPLLTKARCNSGGCHGKAEGQNGFKLSVFGFDPESDHLALMAEGRGRRISLTAPKASLLLRKASARVPHGGGLKLDEQSDGFRLLGRWIAEGATLSTTGEAAVTRIELEPRDSILMAKESQQLQVTAILSDGSRRCVTAEAEFESNASNIAAVGDRGLIVAADIPGEAAILARYLGQVAVCRITMPRPTSPSPRPLENNFVDRLVNDKLQRLGIQPSELSDDSMFLRRAYLDVIGTLPTPDEARRFLNDKNVDKRQKLVADLLQRPEYVEYWTMRWADLLRVDQAAISPQGAVAMTRWLRRQFAANRPYHEMVRELLLAEGSMLAEGPTAFYKAFDSPERISRSISQLFLGVRIECAQCHHHPSEKWSQDDYFALAGFFTGLSRKPLPSGGEAIISRGGTDLKHPRTGEPIATRALGAAPADFSGVSDRRVVLSDWLAKPENPFLTRMIVNRMWAHYFGRGLVEPIDDIRETNPASNEPLLDALCDEMRKVNYDLKAFTATLLGSQTYQLSSQTNESNAADRQNFSHALDKPLPAEVLLDMFSQTLGVPEKFNGWPLGYRSIQLWDSRVPSYFFRVFGRPVRASVCECERSNEPSIAQALHLLNSPELTEKLHHRHGTARRLAESSRTDAELVDELYLGTLSRLPRDQEKQLVLEIFAAASDRREAVEDILWSLLNQKEFLYNH